MPDFPPLFCSSNVYEVFLQLERLEAWDDTGISALNDGENFLFVNYYIRNANN